MQRNVASSHPWSAVIEIDVMLLIEVKKKTETHIVNNKVEIGD